MLHDHEVFVAKLNKQLKDVSGQLETEKTCRASAEETANQLKVKLISCSTWTYGSALLS